MDQQWFCPYFFNTMEFYPPSPFIITILKQDKLSHFFNHTLQDLNKQTQEIENLQSKKQSQRFNSYQIIVPTSEELGKLQKKCSRKYWSAAEDKKLINSFQQFPRQWQKISMNIQGRNEAMCYSRYRRLIQGKKKYWTEEIDKKIIQKVDQNGYKWKKISRYITDRTPKQIRERYLNFLRPNISKSEWTFQQDKKICELIQKLGHKWKQFQEYFQGRTQNQIKGRYYGHLKRILQEKLKQH